MKRFEPVRIELKLSIEADNRPRVDICCQGKPFDVIYTYGVALRSLSRLLGVSFLELLEDISTLTKHIDQAPLVTVDMGNIERAMQNGGGEG